MKFVKSGKHNDLLLYNSFLYREYKKQNKTIN